MRRIRNLVEFSTLFREWKESGLTVREYCSNVGYSESQFYRWKKKYEENPPQAVSPVNSCGFVPVRLSTRTGTLEVSPRCGTVEGTAPRIELTYPNGVTIRLPGDTPIETLRSMVLMIR